MLPEKQSIDEEFGIDQPDAIPFIDFWKFYLNFGYYLLIVPFRLKRTAKFHKLEIHSNRTQKVLCGITQIAILFDFISHLWWSSYHADSKNQLSYFNSFCYVGYIAYHLSLNATFWLKQDTFRLVFDHMQKLKFYDQKKERITVFWINFVACSTFLIALIMAMTDIYLVNSLYTHRSLIMFYSDLERRATLHFLFMDRTKNDKSSEEFSTPFQIFATILTLFQVLILIPSVVLVPYLDLFVLLVPLCVRRIMREFRQFCKNSVGSPYASERILKKYATLKKFIKNLNRAMGILICACVSVSLPYYAAWIGVSFFEKDVHPVMLVHVYAFFLIFFLALSLAADINKKGIEFYCWISSPENSDAISSKTISSLLVDFHSNQIALKGNGFFVITYRFLGTIFGVIVTYAIITIQLQITRRENGYYRPKSEFTMHECICSSNSSSGST